MRRRAREACTRRAREACHLLPRHQSVEVGHIEAKLRLLRGHRGGETAKGADELGEEEGAGEHDDRADDLLAVVKGRGDDVAVADARDSHHRPVDRVDVHRAWRQTRIVAARLADHAVRALLCALKLVRHAIVLLGWPSGEGVEAGLQPPEASEQVADENEPDELLDDGEHRIVDREAHLPPARRCEEEV